jgi:hypothetical protein
MNKFKNYRTTIGLMSLLLLVLPPLLTGDRTVTASSDPDLDPILNANGTSAWTWSWTNLPDYTTSDCPGGHGVVTFSKGTDSQSIAFTGERFADGTHTDTIKFENSGSWEYVGEEKGHRAYKLHWSASTDEVLLSTSGYVLSGRSGSCGVRGNRR